MASIIPFLYKIDWTIFLATIIGGLISLGTTWYFHHKQEALENRKKIYAPLHKELGQIEQFILKGNKGYPYREWAKLQMANLTYFIKPNELRHDIEDLYNNALPAFFSSWNITIKEIIKAVPKELKISSIPVDVKWIVENLAEELAFSHRTRALTHFMANFEQFKKTTGIPFSKADDLVEHLRPKIQEKPFVKHLREERKQILENVQQIRQKLTKKLKLKERKLKTI